MPQLDKFTYLTQFFWLCLIFFLLYISICNNRDGVLGISRILKLRNLLLSHRGKKILSKDPQTLEKISIKGLSNAVSYMYSSLFEVSQWSQQAVDSFGKGRVRGRRLVRISSFGEISGSRGMEKRILYLISKSSYKTDFSWITCQKEIMLKERMLIHVLHGQGIIVF
jgi:hypothetical protein